MCKGVKVLNLNHYFNYQIKLNLKLFVVINKNDIDKIMSYYFNDFDDFYEYPIDIELSYSDPIDVPYKCMYHSYDDDESNYDIEEDDVYNYDIEEDDVYNYDIDDIEDIDASNYEYNLYTFSSCDYDDDNYIKVIESWKNYNLEGLLKISKMKQTKQNHIIHNNKQQQFIKKKILTMSSEFIKSTMLNLNDIYEDMWNNIIKSGLKKEVPKDFINLIKIAKLKLKINNEIHNTNFEQLFYKTEYDYKDPNKIQGIIFSIKNQEKWNGKNGYNNILKKMFLSVQHYTPLIICDTDEEYVVEYFGSNFYIYQHMRELFNIKTEQDLKELLDKY